MLAGGERSRRHGPGSPSHGVHVEALGALETEPGPDRVPAWLTSEGELVLGREPGRSVLRRARRRLDAAGRRSVYRSERRLRTVAAQLYRWRTRQQVTSGGQPPSGYVHTRPGSGRVPLFEGVHPATGDQLLATAITDIEDRGYGPARLIGYVEPAAGPADGRPAVPAATVDAQLLTARTGWGPDCPSAHVDEPAPAAEMTRLPFYFRGWAMFSDQSVTRVDITVDGQTAGRARIGIPRPDLAATCPCSDAPIAGWEYEVGAESTVSRNGTITLSGTVHGSAGREMPLPSRTVRVAAPVPVPVPVSEPEDDVWGEPPARSPTSRRRAAAPIPVTATAADPPATESGPHLLVDTHSLTYGGAQLYLVELLERLVGRGARATLISPTDGPLRERLVRAGITVHIFPQLGGWEDHVLDVRVAELTAFAATRDFDLVLVNTFLSIAGVEIAERLGLPSILAIHESVDPFDLWSLQMEPFDPALPPRLSRAVGAASAVVFEAAATRELYLAHADPQRLITMPYGIDLAAIERHRAQVTRAQARERLGIAPDAQVVLCLGTTEPRKSQASIARAFGRIAGRFPDARLYLVGHGEDNLTTGYARAVEQHVLRIGWPDRVIIRPLTPSPYDWHVAADVLICASDIESLPRVILEAMAFGTPVVSTGIFGIPEVIEDGVSGYLFAGRDEDAIVAALERALASRTPDPGVTAAARARVRDRHDADTYAVAFRRLIDATLDAHRARVAVISSL